MIEKQTLWSRDVEIEIMIEALLDRIGVVMSSPGCNNTPFRSQRRWTGSDGFVRCQSRPIIITKPLSRSTVSLILGDIDN